jgi:hypothetical protein
MTSLPLEEVATTSNRNQPASAVVVLPAEIDLYNREQAYGRLRFACASGASVVIADFTGTRFCDAGSMRRLLAVRHLASVQLRFAIRPGSPVRRMADLMDVERCVPVYPSSGEAAAVIPWAGTARRPDDEPPDAAA